MVDLNKRSLLVATGSLVGAGSVAYEFLGSDEQSGGSSGETGPETSSKITVLGYEDGAMEVSVENTGDTVLDDTLEVVSSEGVEVSREYQLKPGTTTFISVDMAGWSSYSEVVVRDSHDSANADFTLDPNVTINQDPITEEIEISIENTGDIPIYDTFTVTTDIGQEKEVPYSVKPKNTEIFTVDITGWNMNGAKNVEIVNINVKENINLPKVTFLKQPDEDTANGNWDPTDGNSSDWRVVKYYNTGGEVLEATLGIDAFAVGGGGGGGGYNGGGGGGGYTTTETGIQGTFDVTIGSGGDKKNDGNKTKIVHMDGRVRANGGESGGEDNAGDGGSGGGAGNGTYDERGGKGGQNGGDGQDISKINGKNRGGHGQKNKEGYADTTRAFAEDGWELYAGGGGGDGGGSDGRGGSGGGGNGNSNGRNGKGGGGGGQGDGGDGAVLFRWPQHIEVIDKS